MYRGLLRNAAPRPLLAVSASALLAACSQSGDTPSRPSASVARPAFTEDEYGVRTSQRVASLNDRIPKGGGHFKLGSPYKVAGRWYVPREDANYDRVGTASWYGADFHGRRTANGEIFDLAGLTAAHPTLPLPSYAYVTNLENGRTVLVRVNDRGPYVADRIIDLSHASARALGYVERGKARVRVRYAGRAPLNGDDRHERRFLAEQQRNMDRGPVFASAPPQRAPFAVADNGSASYGAETIWSPRAYRAQLAGRPSPSYLGGPPSAKTDHQVWVQAGYFRDRASADVLRARLDGIGRSEVQALTMPSGDQFYRVRLGPFSKDDAAKVTDAAVARGAKDAVAVSQ